MTRTWKQSLVTIPGVGISLLPQLTCPLCWPAYAALLSSVGLGFLISARYLLPLTTATLVLPLAGLAFRAKHRRGYGPFLVGLIAAVGVLVGKFKWGSSLTLYAAVGLLVIASSWNAWPRPSPNSACCTEK